MRNENDDLAGDYLEQRLREGARDASEPPVGVEERRPGVEADPHDLSNEYAARRIVHLTMASARGGLMRVMETLARVQARDHAVLVLSPLEPGRCSEDHRLGWRRFKISGNAALAGHWRLLAALRQFRPDVVFLHAGSPGELALAAALVASRAPAVVVEHATEHYPLGSGVRDVAFSRLKRRAARWLAVSYASARALESRWRLPPGTVGVIHNGVGMPPEGTPSADERALAAGGEIVVGIGRPEPRKGFDTFANVARALSPSLPSVRWVWVGGAPNSAVPPVKVLPWSTSVGWILRRATLLLIPSRAEGLPLVLLEAWACGAAVVASAVGGLPEVVEDGRDAVLVAAEDQGGWIEGVRALLADASARQRLAQRGRQKWSHGFTEDAMAARYAAVMESVIAERTTSPRKFFRTQPRGGWGAS